jgi:hypothetical protein
MSHCSWVSSRIGRLIARLKDAFGQPLQNHMRSVHRSSDGLTHQSTIPRRVFAPYEFKRKFSLPQAELTHR